MKTEPVDYNHELESYQNDLRENGEYPPLHFAIGECLYQLKRYEEALRAFGMARKFNGDTFVDSYDFNLPGMVHKSFREFVKEQKASPEKYAAYLAAVEKCFYLWRDIPIATGSAGFADLIDLISEYRDYYDYERGTFDTAKAIACYELLAKLGAGEPGFIFYVNERLNFFRQQAGTTVE
jgi:tetratricopeptide (TPR) repeat protein